MKRAAKILLLVPVLLLLVTGAALVWLINDESLLRSQFEKAISGATGRDVSISRVEVWPGTTTRVRIQGLKVANPPWTGAESLLVVQRAEATVDFSSFFSAGARIDQVKLDGVLLNLEEDPDGRNNWSTQPQHESVEKNRADGEPAQLPWNTLQLTNFRLSHISPSREVPLEFRLDGLNAHHKEGGEVSLSSTGVVGGYPLKLDAQLNPLQRVLLEGAFAYRLELSLGEMVLVSGGTVEDALTGSGVNLGFQFSGPEFSWLLDQAALPEFSSGAFDVSGSVGLKETGQLALQLNGDFGSLEASASGQLNQLRDPSQLDLRFDISGPDLHALGEAFDLPQMPTSAFDASGKISLARELLAVEAFDVNVEGDTLTASGALGAWPALSGTDLNVQVRARDFSRWGPAIQFDGLGQFPFLIDARIREQGGAVSVETRSLEIEGQTLAVTGALERTGEGTRLDSFVLESGQGRVSLSGLVAWQATEAANEATLWPQRMSGSHISGELQVPDVGALAASLGYAEWPGQPVSLEYDARMEQGVLTVAVENGALGELRLALEGRVPNLPSLKGATAALDLQLPSLKVIEMLVDRQDLPDVPLQLRGSVQHQGNLLQFDQLNGTVGKSTLALGGQLQLDPEIALKSVRFSASGPDFRRLLDRPELENLPARFHVAGEAQLDDRVHSLQNVEVRLGESAVYFEGTVDHLVRPQWFDLDVRVESANPQELLPFVRRFHEAELPEDPLQASFVLHGEPGGMELSGLQIQLDQSALSGHLSFGLGEVLEIRGELDSDYFDLSWLQKESAAVEAQLDPSVSGANSSASQGAGDQSAPARTRVFSDEPITLLSEYPMVMDLEIDARSLQFPHSRMVQVRMGVKRTTHSLRLEPLEISGSRGGGVSGVFELTEADERLNLVVKGQARGFKLGLATTPGQDPATFPAWDFQMDFHANGATTQEMAESANGGLAVIVGEGELSNSRLRLIFSDILSELYSQLNPLSKRDARTHLQCAVGIVDLANGTAQVDPLIIQTNQVIASSTGSINLATEALNLGFTTRPRQGIGISAGAVVNPFVRLGGTMARPNIALDPAGAAISGSAAVATAGLSLLGKSLYDRFMREKDPCGKVVAELRKLYAEGGADAP